MIFVDLSKNIIDFSKEILFQIFFKQIIFFLQIIYFIFYKIDCKVFFNKFLYRNNFFVYLIIIFYKKIIKWRELSENELTTETDDFPYIQRNLVIFFSFPFCGAVALHVMRFALRPFIHMACVGNSLGFF